MRYSPDGRLLHSHDSRVFQSADEFDHPWLEKDDFWQDIRDYGLLPGNMAGHGALPEIYFTPKWRDFGGPSQTIPEYECRGTVCIVIDDEAAIDKGTEFWITNSNQIADRP